MKEMIKNKYLKVEMNLLGGSLTSIFDKENNEEILYQPEIDAWQGQDVAIFPFVARLKNKTYTYKDKEYSLRNHGLCRYYGFEVVDKKDDSITLLFKSNEDTLKEYPFLFHFYITYQVENKTLHISYKVTNDNEEIMPFGIGAHPAFKLNSVINEKGVDTRGNCIILNQPTSLNRICFDKNGEFVVGKEPYKPLNEIDIDKEIFREYKTLCLEGDNLKDVILKRKDGRFVRFHYENIKYFILWSNETTGSFVAIEPWISLPDFMDADKDIMKKKTLIHLKGKESYIFSYSVTIE